MHRVRVGLTGLACVFLLVLLATAVLHLAQRDTTATVAGRHPTTAAPTNLQDAPSEPLAQLGVVPGNAPAQPSVTPPSNAALPQPRR